MPGRVFVDTNVWLYALVQSGNSDPRHGQARDLLPTLQRPVISHQVIREASVNLLKRAAVGEVELRRLVLAWYRDCEVWGEDEGVFLRASELRERLNFSYWDSLIVATALMADCAVLYSEDMQHGQTVEGQLRIFNPFRREITGSG